MKIDISPELVRSYFQDKCTAEEKNQVERWLKADELNYQTAMQWLGEDESDDDEAFLSALLMSEEDVLKNTKKAISQLDGGQDYYKKGKSRKNGLTGMLKTDRFWYGMAASVVVMVVSVLAVKTYVGSKVTEVKTAFRETRKIVLPDYSAVILNGNSTLTYKTEAFETKREVCLNGEAFFDISHLPDSRTFRVHLSDNKTVEVLGTEFNISERNDLSQIILKSGKIRLDIPEEEQHIEMHPGELVEVNSFRGSISRKNVNAELYYSWIYGKWKFDGNTLLEVLAKVEETQGVKVRVYDQSLLSRKISGTIPLHDNAEKLIRNVANAFDLTSEDHNGHIYLKERK